MTRFGRSTAQMLAAVTVFFCVVPAFCGSRWTGADISNITASTNEYPCLTFTSATNAIREISSMDIVCETDRMANWMCNTDLTRTRKFNRSEELRLIVELLYESGLVLEKRGDVLYGVPRTNRTDLAASRDASLEGVLAARAGLEGQLTLDYNNAPLDMVMHALAEHTDTFIICSPVVYMDNGGAFTLKGTYKGIGIYFEELARRGLALQRVTDRILVLKGMPEKIDRIFSQAQSKQLNRGAK